MGPSDMDRNRKAPHPTKPDDALERQLKETRRREHEKHLGKYRQSDPNAPH